MYTDYTFTTKINTIRYYIDVLPYNDYYYNSYNSYDAQSVKKKKSTTISREIIREQENVRQDIIRQENARQETARQIISKQNKENVVSLSNNLIGSKDKSKLSPKQDEDECHICMEHIQNAIIVPCGHMLCFEGSCKDNIQVCHMCRGPIEKIIKMHKC